MLRFLAILILLQGLCAGTAYAADLTVLLTSNLEARFSFSGDDEPMLALASEIVRNKPSDGLYIDLGNAFYPGALSRYSYGAVMAEFFDAASCDAALISSRDMKIGVDSLTFLQSASDRKTRFLSASVVKNGASFFPGGFVRRLGREKIAFIALSSRRMIFDLAEESVYNVSLLPPEKAYETALASLGADINRVVLLSGLSMEENMALLNRHPEICVVLAGGDNRGDLFDAAVPRIERNDGRSIFCAVERGYYTLTLSEGEIPSGFVHHPVTKREVSPALNAFRMRLSFWKQQYLRDQGPALDVPFALSDQALAHLLRHRYRTESAFVVKGTVKDVKFVPGTSLAAVADALRDENTVLTTRVTGETLLKALSDPQLVASGGADEKIRGEDISSRIQYTVSCTQAAWFRLRAIEGKELAVNNMYKTPMECIQEDLSTDRTLVQGDYNYLDDRFGFRMKGMLSLMFQRSSVHRSADIDTPPGMPEESYYRWGVESSLAFDLYSRLHSFTLVPYIDVLKEGGNSDPLYVYNTLRGTFVYSYLEWAYIHPYAKSVCESVVMKTDDGRPVLIRETAGVDLNWWHLKGKMGLGIEKKVKDPSGPSQYGFETILGCDIPLPWRFRYVADFDSFLSRQNDDNSAKINISHGLSYSLMRWADVSFKHRFYYLYSSGNSGKYRNSEIYVSVDLKMHYRAL